MRSILYEEGNKHKSWIVLIDDSAVGGGTAMIAKLTRIGRSRTCARTIRGIRFLLFPPTTLAILLIFTLTLTKAHTA